MGRVFLVQRPSVRQDGRWADKYDLAPAKRYGELVECLPPGNIPRELSVTRDRLRASLRDFDLGRDYMVAIGHPIAIAMAVLIVGSGVRLLKWDRREGEYFPFTIES